MVDQTIINSLIQQPAESLNVEIKRWIDPNDSANIAKIIKGVFALRNRNGGFFIFGFDDKTLTADVKNTPSNPRELFHIDVIQNLISKYASEAFEVEIAWAERGGYDYPVIAIPSGVKTPVATKYSLELSGKTLIKYGAVYFRSLSSNGTPSTTEARHSDWADIVEICFDNREADVGRFIRRHLRGINFSSLCPSLQTMHPRQLSTCERAQKLINRGEADFKPATQSRALSQEETSLLQNSFFSIGFVIDPPINGGVADKAFLAKLHSSNPNYTGWPIWRDFSSSSIKENHPIVTKGRYQSLAISIVQGFSNHVDFAQFDPNGEFFLHRLLQDDGIPTKIRPKTLIDPLLMIIRIAEAMAVGISFAKALGCVTTETNLGFAFRWRGLKDRKLVAWANPFANLFEGGTSHDDVVDSCVQFSLDTPLSALPQFVDEATKNLFSAFEGATIPIQTIEDRVRRLLERKL